MKIIKIMGVFLFIAGLMSLSGISATDPEKSDDCKAVESKKEVVQTKIQLFIYKDCPYCLKVTQFLELHNLMNQVELLDASLPEYKDQLKLISGKTQAPYLVDSSADIKMAESNDIISYLVKKFNTSVPQDVVKVEVLKDVEPVVTVNKDTTSFDQDPLQKFDMKTFFTDVENSSIPVIVLVSTTWCPPCKLFKPIFIQFAQEMSAKCKFMLVDADVNRDLAIALEIRTIPTLVCYKNGKRVYFDIERSTEGLIKLVEDICKN